MEYRQDYLVVTASNITWFYSNYHRIKAKIVLGFKLANIC